MADNGNASLDDLRELGREHGRARARAFMAAKLAAPSADGNALYDLHVTQVLDREENRLRSHGADDSEIDAYGKAAIEALNAELKEGVAYLAAGNANITGNRAQRRAAKAKARGKGPAKA